MMIEKWDISVDEFKQAISVYSQEDYYENDPLPIQYLVDLLYCDYERYMPYKQYLIEDGCRKGISAEFIAGRFEALSDKIRTIHAVFLLIKKVAEDTEFCDRVCALPIMCGKGKSSAISYLIKERIKMNEENQEKNGIIIVTDDIERLQAYVVPSHNPSLYEWFKNNMKQITVMRADNRVEAMKRQYFTPILFMTTQWYFSLSREEIKDFLKWRGGKRNLIIFDERPPLREVIHVQRGDLHCIAAALADGIGDAADQNEKQWCIQEWNKAKDRLYETVDAYERRHLEKKTSYFFYSNPTKHLTSDDERFWKFIRKNESQIKRYQNGTAYKKLKAVHRIETEGAIFQSQKGWNYSNKFSVMIDNREIIEGIGARVIILDGTAEIHPDYKQEYIHIPDYIHDDEYEPYVYASMTCSTLTFVNIPTSKSHFTINDRNNALKKGIIEYLKRLPEECMQIIGPEGEFIPWLGPRFDCKKIPIFTYPEIEEYFKREGFERLEHFGNIRGKNKYRNDDALIQIGLNRFDPLHYLSYAMYSNPTMIEQMRALSEEEASIRIENYVKNTHSNADIMYPMIFDDIEQNFFRGINRRKPSTVGSHMLFSEYWLFCNTETNRELIELVKRRYEKLGVFVRELDTPREIKRVKMLARVCKKPTAYQACSQWLDNVEVGTVFKKKDIIEGAGVTDKAFDEMHRKTPEFKMRLDSMAIEGKKRVYMKR